MASFAELTAQLNLNIQNFVTGLNNANKQATKFAANLEGKINKGMVKPADQAAKSFKNVGRVVQGILISQAFYAGLRSIREATDAAWEFTNQLEKAKVAYTGLFGDVQLAQEFINVLKDFSLTTGFAFSDAEQAARKLVSYGVDYSNLMYVVTAAINAASFTGDSASINAVATALGKVYQQGRLSTYELRTLTNAGIPAYEILAEKLNLTAEELRNINDLAIPAHTAINALVDGINERFNDVRGMGLYTIQGLTNTIKNSLLIISQSFLEPLAARVRTILLPIRNFLLELAELAQNGGIGALFERLIPERLHASVRQLIVNIQILFDIIRSNLGSLWNVLGAILEGIMMAINALAPFFKVILGVVAVLNKVLFENATILRIISILVAIVVARFLLVKAAGLALLVVKSVITVITGAIKGLIVVLTFLAAHPVFALLIAIGVVVLGLTGAFTKLKNAVMDFFKTLDRAAGYDPDKTLLPSQKDRANDLGKFNDRLAETGDLMGDLADETGKATKAAKGLLGFDEVFKLNNPDEGIGNGIGDIKINWDDFDWNIPDLDFDFDIGDIFPELATGEIGAAARDWVGSFYDWLLDLFGSEGRLFSTALGALLGAILGGLIGGPLGALIGAIVGGIAGYFWDMLADALGVTDVGRIAIPIATVLGAAIGFLTGGIPGALIGAGIGALVGWIIDRIAYGMETGDWSDVALPIGALLGAAIGFLAGGPLGALIGTGVGLLVGQVINKIIEGFTTGNWDPYQIAWPIGTLIGAGIGLVVGGPVGALIGAAIGALVGWIVGLIIDNWQAISDVFTTAWMNIVNFFDWLGGVISDTLRTAWMNISNWVSDLGALFADWASNAYNTIAQWCIDVVTAIGDWVSDTWNAISQWSIDVATTIGDWAVNTWQTFSGWVSNVGTSIATWASNTGTTITTWASNTWNSIRTWASNTGNSISNWATTTWNSIRNWSTNTWATFTSWANNTWNSIRTWSTNTGSTFTTWASSVWSTFTSWGSNVGSTMSSTISSLWQTIREGCANMLSTFTNWISDLWSNVFNTLFGWIDDAIQAFRDLFSASDRAERSSRTRSGGTDVRDRSISLANLQLPGHATGGIFNREHIARFAEGNKAEAVIPLQNANAMQPFSDMLSDSIAQALLPTLVANGTSSDPTQQPVYVGTLIADERSLKELNRKLKVIELSENKRRGFSGVR